ncbi:hypothetical protein NDU88_001682 [Pleurodeles waltl]|uniref:Uncharacterized protein n=1 Tax=Pleurodeles waltl TaxID=8319 RepID=A0AAV7RDB1_PLEWA|nr:hypothetical protein NDU88_001682 [Pleurodeles waltl]
MRSDRRARGIEEKTRWGGQVKARAPFYFCFTLSNLEAGAARRSSVSPQLPRPLVPSTPQPPRIPLSVNSRDRAAGRSRARARPGSV